VSPPNGHTIRWRGVMSETKSEGLDMTDLATFIHDAEELSRQLGVWPGIAVPVVVANYDGSIRRIWVGVQRRRWTRLSGIWSA
jgi:hypothetical protein